MNHWSAHNHLLSLPIQKLLSEGHGSVGQGFSPDLRSTVPVQLPKTWALAHEKNLRLWKKYEGRNEFTSSLALRTSSFPLRRFRRLPAHLLHELAHGGDMAR